MMSLYRAQEIKMGEEKAAEIEQIPLYQLMQRAGFAAYQLSTQCYPLYHHYVVFCGRGNNAGDGYIFALQAVKANQNVIVIQIDSEKPLAGDAGIAQQSYIAHQGEILDSRQWQLNLPVWLPQAIVVDALLGTGLTQAPRLTMASIIELINDLDNPVLSLDIPSGLNTDTGTIAGVCVCANHTVTFVADKIGLHTGAARNVSGEICVASLGIEQAFTASVTSNVDLYTHQDIERLLPIRLATAHKGEAGKVLMCGGNEGMGGALMLAGKAAHRVGAGMVASLTHPQHTNAVLSFHPECMVSGWEGDKTHVESRLAWCDVIAIGPGLGQNDWWSRTLFSLVLKQLNQQFSDKFLVIDADALHFLAGSPKPNVNQVITPHPGEAAVLLSCSIHEIESDRLAAAERLHQMYGGVVLLKGAGTVIYNGERWAIIDTGHQGMATAGMGDVLTGIITGLVAQGLPPMQASILGALIHGYAAQLCHENGIKIGLLASDLLLPVTQIVSQLPPMALEDAAHRKRLRDR